MHILVLDTIHGGRVIAEALRARGHSVDMVDVYRGQAGISPEEALRNSYDLIVAPVHLDPAYPLLERAISPVISHHQAVKWILGPGVPHPFIEITGARGKTTTAHALAHLLGGPGILHTSKGTHRYPSKASHGKFGITPASLIDAASHAYSIQGWMVAEISLGFAGAGQLGILTSMETYSFAAKKKDAVEEKMRSARSLPCVILPPGTKGEGTMISADEIVEVKGDTCRFGWKGMQGEFSSHLFSNEAYRVPLTLAAAAACVLGIDPAPLAMFGLLEGRLNLSKVGKTVLVDDSNSGTCAATARQAIRLARQEAGSGDPLTLVIGKEDGAICEGFPGDEIATLIRQEAPERVILVGSDYRPDAALMIGQGIRASCCDTLAEGRDLALAECRRGMVVLAVKTWR